MESLPLNLLAVVPLALSMFGVYLGIVAIVSPKKFLALSSKWVGFDRISQPASSMTSISLLKRLETRFVGIVMTVFSWMFVLISSLALLKVQHGSLPDETPVPVEASAPSLYSLISGAILVLGGILLVLKPVTAIELFLRKMMPPRTLNPDSVPRIKPSIRAMGVLAVLAGIAALRGFIRIAFP